MMSFFLIVFSKVYTFFENLKYVICYENGVLKFAFEKHVHRVLLEIILALTNFTSNRYRVKNFT